MAILVLVFTVCRFYRGSFRWWLDCFSSYFGFNNIMSAQQVGGIQGLVAMNSLMAMVSGILAATFVGNKDPGFVHNGL